MSMSKNYNLKEIYSSMQYVITCDWNWLSMLLVPHSWSRKGKQDWLFFFSHLIMSRVLVHAGCYYKMPEAGWFINHVIYHSSKARSSRSGSQHGWVSEGLFQVISLYRRDEQVFQASFTRALIPFMWALPHDLIIFQWSHFLKSLLWGLGFQHMSFGRPQAFRPWHPMRRLTCLR